MTGWVDILSALAREVVERRRTEETLTRQARLLDIIASKKKGKAPLGKIVAVYPYTDENAELLFQVVRYEPKDFRQRRPNKSTQRGWIWDLDGVRLVPYRLRQVLAAIAAGQIILVVEGEKDVGTEELRDSDAGCEDAPEDERPGAERKVA